MSGKDQSYDIFELITEFDERVSHLESDRVVREALLFCLDRLKLQRASITLLTEDRSAFRPLVLESRSDDAEILPLIPIDETHLGEVIASGCPSYRPDLSQSEPGYPLDAKLRDWGLKSDFSVPLLIEGECIGTLNSGSSEVDGVSDEVRRLLILLGPRLAHSLRNSQLYSQLQQSKARYHDICENSNAAIYTFDQSKNFIDTNPAGLELLGYSREELLGMSIPDVDADPQAVLPAHRELLGGKILSDYEHQLKRKDGRIITVLNNSIPLLDEHGKVVGMQSILFDISARRQREELIHLQQKLVLAVGKAVNLEEILQLCTRALIKVAGADCGGLLLVDDAGENLDLRYAEGLSEQFLSEVGRYDPNSVRAGLVMGGGSLFVGREECTALMPPAQRDEQISCFAALPRRLHDKVFGCIAAGSHQLDAIPSEVEESLETLTTQISAIVSRAQIVEKLRLSEERYRTLFMSMREGVIQTGPEGTVVEANPSAARILGYADPAEMIGKPTTDFWADPEERARLFEQLDAEGAASNIELRARRRDGSTVTVLASGKVDYGRRGEVVRSVFAFTDFSDYKQVEEALQTSEQKYRTIAYYNYDWEYWIDRDGIYKYVSPSVERITGYSPAEFIQDPGILKRIIHPDDWEMVARHKHKITASEEVLPLTFRIITREGDVRWISHHCQPVIDARGENLGRRGSNRDVTLQMQTEQELRKSERRFRSLTELSPATIVETDAEGNLVFLNRAGHDILGYKPDELSDANILDFVVPEDRERVVQNVGRLLAGEQLDGIQYTGLRHDGTLFPVVVYANVIRQDGEPSGVRAIVVDVTRQKALEDKLRHSLKLEGIGRLAGGIAHDFNNILTAINGYTEMVLMRLEQEQDPRTWRELNLVLEGGRKAEELVRQLLAFSRKQMIQPQTVDVNQTVNDLERMLSRTISEDIEIELSLTEETALVNADPGQLEQIIVNLVVNARDAIDLKPAGSRRITIETAPVELDVEFVATHLGSTPGSYIMISVSDTGIGMDEQTLERIFEPFFTTKDIGKGTGLGLSTVYGIVKQNEGNIFAESVPGEGSVFRIYWPRLQEGSPAQPSESLGEVQGGDEVILFVEDDPQVRDISISKLRSLGYTVLEAGDGVAALELVRAGELRVDLLITDLVMPEMNGKDLASVLSEMQPDLKLLYISGYTEEYIVEDGKLERGVNFLAKPYSGEKLAVTVRSILDAE